MSAPPTPEVYLTPQLKKRRDGLCPSLFHAEETNKTIPGGISKAYRTNSNLLLQIPQQEGISREVLEMQALAQSITKGLKARVGSEKDVISMDFEPRGCRWFMALNENANGAGENYRIEVICKANEFHGVINYVIDTVMCPIGEADPNPLAPPMKGYREAKQAFDLVAIAARKSVVRLEFPEFPEGCKGRPFREVYQLNARVSDCFRSALWHENKWGSFLTAVRIFSYS